MAWDNLDGRTDGDELIGHEKKRPGRTERMRLSIEEAAFINQLRENPSEVSTYWQKDKQFSITAK